MFYKNLRFTKIFPCPEKVYNIQNRHKAIVDKSCKYFISAAIFEDFFSFYSPHVEFCCPENN